MPPSLRFLLLCGVVLLTGSRGLAQDRVTYVPEGQTRPVIAVGDITNLTGSELFLKGFNSVQRIPIDAVSHIETTYQPEHLQGEAQFHSGKTAEAQVSLRKALDKENREWIDREILALLVQCSLRENDLQGAIRDFRFLLTSDPVTRHWNIAPLAWTPTVVSESLRQQLRPWLDPGSSPADQLLAGSLLLTDPAAGKAAEECLLRLNRDTHPIYSSYSKAQLWRIEIAKVNVSEISLQRWRDLIDSLPRSARPGPQYLLSRGHDVRGELRLAAAEALWIPYDYPDNELLSARALFDAAEALERSELRTESQTCLAELMQRYPWSREAGIARNRIPSLPRE